MPDNFAVFKTNLESPATNAYLVAPNDSADLPVTTRALMVNADGSVKMEFAKDPSGSFVTIALKAGQTYPFRIRKIYSNGTNATGITALY
jgi:hypothetical protein